MGHPGLRKDCKKIRIRSAVCGRFSFNSSGCKAKETAEAFAKEYPAAYVHEGYDALVQNPK